MPMHLAQHRHPRMYQHRLSRSLLSGDQRQKARDRLKPFEDDDYNKYLSDLHRHYF